MNTKKRIFLIIIVFTVLFIWSNSLKTGDASMNSSDGLKQAFIDLLKSFGINLENSFFMNNIRKFAHFTEYFILGGELFLFRNFYLKKSLSTLLNITYFGVFTAFFDETIQLIPALGRSGEVVDVWIDIFGIILSFLILKVFFVFAEKIKKHKSLQK